MKLTVKIYTERGPFKGKVMEVPEADLEHLKDTIMLAITDGKYFKIETDDGFIVLGKELLRSAVLEVEQESEG
jgi:hypothetical protein